MTTLNFDVIIWISAIKPPLSLLWNDVILNFNLFLSFILTKSFSVQAIGKHTIAAMPKAIATFFKLSKPELYTGHCFRRTSATIFANEGGDFVNLKDLGGWKSDTVTPCYIQRYINQKEKICNVLTNAINLPGQINSYAPQKDVLNSSTEMEIDVSKSNFVFNNSVVHIHNYAK